VFIPLGVSINYEETTMKHFLFNLILFSSLFYSLSASISEARTSEEQRADFHKLSREERTARYWKAIETYDDSNIAFIRQNQFKCSLDGIKRLRRLRLNGTQRLSFQDQENIGCRTMQKSSLGIAVAVEGTYTFLILKDDYSDKGSKKVTWGWFDSKYVMSLEGRKSLEK
jgi:hypothetical protein